MAVIKIENFGGMIPAQDDRLLPATAAAYLSNAWIYSGALTGMNAPTPVYNCQSGTTTKVFRIPKSYIDAAHIADSYWMEFQNPDTDVLHAPVMGDVYDRYYWVSPPASPYYSTSANIKAGGLGAYAPLILGVNAPASAPTVSHAGGVSGVSESRAYVYTWVSAYGEEGPPSPPVLVNGKVDDTYTLTLPATTSGDTTNRNLVSRNIYRTVVAAGGTANFFYVATLPIATLSYADAIPDATVSGNAIMECTDWSPPPTDLLGWISLPNGMIAGFREHEIWFCEPYRPHAWPAEYAIAVAPLIVGLGVIDQSLIICTQDGPYTATGPAPGAMTLAKLGVHEPCMARGSIVSTLVTTSLGSTLSGVLYTSPNGLILVAPGVAQNVTAALLSKENWGADMPLLTLRAARFGQTYYCWGSKTVGCFNPGAFDPLSFSQDDFYGCYVGALIDVANGRVGFTALSNPVPVLNCWNDEWSGEVFVIRNGVVSWINFGDQNPTHETFIWRSRVLQVLYKENLEAARVYFDIPATTPAQNPTRDVSQPMAMAAGKYAVFRIYANGKLVRSQELRASGEMIRFPSGLKADYWQVEVEGVVRIFSIELGTSAKELKNV